MPDYKGLQVPFMQRSPIGSQFGNWIVERKLGHGGNGVVWRVVGTGNRVGAMKFLSPWMDDNGIYYFDRKRYARFAAFSSTRLVAD